MPEFPYSAHPPKAKPSPVVIESLRLETAIDPKGYLPDEGLVDAVNVALLLQQPLLLTGEPGTGKSQLAFSLAYQLGLDEPLVFETKSTSVAGDLFYQFDAVRRFQAAHGVSEALDPRDFITFQALGLAILRSQPWERVAHVAAPRYRHQSPIRSVVLIDEIDKAPRDFPNDILNEIERMYFVVPELRGTKVEGNPDCRPVVVMTSNSEKGLPDPFLRRCIFYNIPFPDKDRLEQIVVSRVKSATHEDPLLQDAIDLLEYLRRDETGLRKKPGTAELLNWYTALMVHGVDLKASLKRQIEVVNQAISTLAKNPEDQERVIEAVRGWSHEESRADA